MPDRRFLQGQVRRVLLSLTLNARKSGKVTVPEIDRRTRSYFTSSMPRQDGAINNDLNAVDRIPLIRFDEVAKDAELKRNLCTSSIPGSRHSGVLTTFHWTVEKVEHMSSGESVKDRIAKRMVEAGEAEAKRAWSLNFW